MRILRTGRVRGFGEFNIIMVHRNIISNFIGAGIAVIITAFCTPFYIKILGVESYGLIGLFASIQSLIVLLDIGLSPAFSRELALESVRNDSAQRLRDLLRTLEVPYWILGGIIGLVLIVISPYLANNWVKPQTLTHEVVQQVFILLSINTAIQWPASLYNSGLTGLQQITILNIIRVFCSIFRYFGGLGMLLYAPNISVFFVWQIISSSIQTMLTAWILWQLMPKSNNPPQFSPMLLSNIRQFAGGITLISVVAILLIQLDKFILSRLLSLQDFGYYTFAGSLVTYLSGISGAITTPYAPKLTQLVSLNNQTELSRIYHEGSIYVSTFMLPVAIMLIFFSKEIIFVWTNDLILVQNTYWIVSLLAIGSAINALTTLPSYLQLAYGWIRLSLVGFCLEVIILVPFILLTAPLVGVISGALSWILINAGFMIFALPIMHRRILKGELFRWYVGDIGIPFISVFFPAILMRMFLMFDLPRIQLGVVLVIIMFVLVIFSWRVTPKLHKLCNPKVKPPAY